eukprot:6185048-Pleurochrysis_carterae.AAC.4
MPMYANAHIPQRACVHGDAYEHELNECDKRARIRPSPCMGTTVAVTPRVTLVRSLRSTLDVVG